MRKRIEIFLVCILLMVSSIVVVLPVKAVKASGNTLYVGGSGSGNYTTIQSAVDVASPGYTVFVFNGIYNENVVVNKSISLIGDDKYNTIIDAYGLLGGDAVVIINADWVNMSGFNINNCGYGIELYYSNYSTISGNIVPIGYSSGIEMSYSNNNTISGNYVNGVDTGIRVICSNYNTITGNNASGSASGIALGTSNYNTVTGNTVHGSNLAGIELENSNNNIISGNTAVSGDVGMHLSFSSYNTITGNNISGHDPINIRLSSSNYNVIYNNIFIRAYSDTKNAVDDGNNFWNISNSRNKYSWWILSWW